jgi:uncharacterized protein
MIRRFAAALLLLVAACAKPAPEQARPALWEVTGPKGEKAWLFGTIHALDKPVIWRTAKLEAALAGSDRLLVEVAGLDDPAALSALFQRIATTPGQASLDQRIAPAERPALEALLLKTGLNSDQFGSVETWATALTLARAASPEQDSALGVDRALLRLAKGKPVIELEGAEAQLRIFDALPEADQRDLLTATVAEAAEADRSADLAQAWAKGDMAAIGTETTRGLLADPELRAALLIGRNRAWVDKIAALLGQGAHPLIAVGAAHMAGSEGLPVLLAARGWTVTRIQ